MKPNELEVLIANALRDNGLIIDEFIAMPSVETKAALPKKPAGYFTQTNDDGHYHLSKGEEWIDLGTTSDEEIDTQIDQIQEDIKNLKGLTGDPEILSEYVKKEDFNDSVAENVIPLTDDEIDNILQGGA